MVTQVRFVSIVVLAFVVVGLAFATVGTASAATSADTDGGVAVGTDGDVEPPAPPPVTDEELASFTCPQLQERYNTFTRRAAAFAKKHKYVASNEALNDANHVWNTAANRIPPCSWTQQ